MLGTNSRGTPIHLNETEDVCTNGTPVHSKDYYLARGSLCIMHLTYFQSKVGQSVNRRRQPNKSILKQGPQRKVSICCQLELSAEKC